MLTSIFALIAAGTLYASAGTVTHVTEGGQLYNDTVQIETTAGTWTAYADDLEIGDHVAMLMYDINDTPHDITDDIILTVKYVAR